MVQSLNVFNLGKEPGSLTLATNHSLFNTKVVSTEGTALIARQAVKIVDNASLEIEVTAATVNTDKIFGFVNFANRSETFAANSGVQVAGNAAVMWMIAGAAIAKGAAVEVVIASKKVITQSAGTTVGTALDKAAADGDFIRVLINTAA